MRLTRLVIALSCAFVHFAVSARAQQTAQKPITLAAIIEAMEARQKRTASVSVRWIHNEKYHESGTAAEYRYPSEMLIKGDLMRYSGQNQLHDRGEVTLIDHLATWDGKESRYLQGTTPLRGRILAKRGNQDAYTVELLPLMLYFRPLADPPAKLNRKALKLADGHKTIGGHECVTIDDGHFRVDLDCTRDFIPVSFEAYGQDGYVFHNGTLEYYHGRDAMAWVPKSFETRLHWKSTGVAERIWGESVQTAIGVPLEDSSFRLTFAPGTIVWDQRTQEEYRLREDGSKEPMRQLRRKRPPQK
jgi:hypothetical protein